MTIRIREVVIGILLLHGSVAFAARQPAAPLALPEIDLTPEVIAVSVGGRAVIARFENDGRVVRMDGKNVKTLPADAALRGPEAGACSQVTRTADARAACEAEARLTLAKASGANFVQATKGGFASIENFSFKRSGDRAGTVTVHSVSKPLTVRISTPDELLTRVRLLGVTDADVAVILVESAREETGIVRARSQIVAYDRDGRRINQVELDHRERGLPHGDYAVVNEKGELGILRMRGDTLSVEWRPLAAAARAAAQNPAPSEETMPEALAAGFDYDRFAQISSDIDGDEGRVSNRPISRAQVMANIDKYLGASWVLSRANHLQGGVANDCRPAEGRIWKRPRRLDGAVGRNVSALPYKWGGYMSVENFLDRITGNVLAGSVCACNLPEQNYCVVGNAAGIDCSGFVSRVWEIDRFTTATLDRITDPVSWRQLRRGDAVNKPRSHVRIFLEKTQGNEIGFLIAESSVSCGGVCRRVVGARELDGYSPRRFKHIVE